MEKQNYYREIFRVRLNKLMIEREITNVKLAKSLDVSKGLISKYTTGVSSPSYENLVRIADFFDVSIDYLAGKRDIYKDDSEYTQLVYQNVHIMSNIKKKNTEEYQAIEQMKTIVEKISNAMVGQDERKLIFTMITLMEMLEAKNLEEKEILNEMKMR